MFVQIIEGRTDKPEEVNALGERWQRELRPGATGYLGITAGVTPDGRAIMIVRFDSVESAQANSARPEQGAFFEEASKLYDGPPAFAESTDTETFLGGIDASAQFVQVMKTSGVDRVQMKGLDDQFDKFAALRPDLLGSFRIWTAPDQCYEVAYFTDEAAARAGESQELPADVQELMEQFGEVMANTEYFDLVKPQIN